MPADIRNFFGGKGAAPTPKPASPALKGDKNGTANKRRSAARKVIEDSDEDIAVETKQSTPKKAAPKKAVKNSPKGEETTTSDYFATSKAKTPKATPIKSNVKPEPAPINKPAVTKTSTNKSPVKSEPKRRKAPVTYADFDEGDDAAAFLDDDEDAGDDIFAADVRTNGKRKDDGYLEISSDEDIKPVARKTAVRANGKSPKTKSLKEDEDVDMQDNVNQPANNQASASRKRKTMDVEDDDEEDSDALKKASKFKAAAKKPPAKRKKQEDVPESSAIQAILDSIPTVRAPSPPPKDSDAGKPDWRKAGANNSAAPPAVGTKEIPVGAENCLLGLTLVFTGLLETLTREASQELAKRYGAKVTSAPSGKTSYVVLGSDAGPSKLTKIRSLNIKTIDEDGLFELIRRLPANGGDGKAAEKALIKSQEEDERIRKEADDMEKEEKRRAAEELKEAKRIAAARGAAAPTNITLKPSMSTQLWTTKYAPTQMNQICGNKGSVEKIQRWLAAWPKSHKFGFQLPGPDGMGGYRAIIISGPPGLGKTTAAHLAAKLQGYDIIESNASDTRSKKLVETGLGDVFNNKSLLGYYAGDGKKVESQKQKIVLIMDEVDGMSSGDRGGVVALAQLCKKTDVPMILICNERRIPKMKPLDHIVYDITFQRPTIDMIRARIMTICHREGLKLEKAALEAIIEGSNRDIRQIVNMLAQMKLDQTVMMTLDDSKSMSKAWAKHVVLKPWDICHKLLGSGMFAPNSEATLNDKIELYFNDHEFSYLMVQENYITTRPWLATSQDLSPREQKLKILELADKAAESISDGDLVDRMIHGSQQQWSLMPVHGVFSTVRPASFMSGAMTGKTSFTSWLGNNSKHGKLMRYVKEIQSHMRLRTSGDRHEIRQQYLPVLWEKLVKRLEVEGRSSVEEVIELMDSYFLTRDDFDYMMELGLGYQDQGNVKIETATKSAFTRLYNAAAHPMPFMKASTVTEPKKAVKSVPDLEEALDEDDDDDVAAEPKVEKDDLETDLKKDKFIKQPKKKAAPKKKKAAKNEDDEDEDEDLDDVPKAKKPRASKGKAAAGKGKANK